MMLDNKISDRLKSISEKFGGIVVRDYPAGIMSAISAGGGVDLCYMASSTEGLKEAVLFLEEERIKTKVIGKCSNILISDSGFNGVAIKLAGDQFEDITFDGNIAEVSSGAELRALIRSCMRSGLSGLEGLVGIPGTVGGALFNNASAFSSISDLLVKVLVLEKNGVIHWVPAGDIKFSYRKTSFSGGQILLKAVFELVQEDPVKVKKNISGFYRKKSLAQPLSRRSLGCVFKNDMSGEYKAGEVIDSLGFKGKKIGGAEISRKHANFIINSGGATAQDIISLMDEIFQRSREVLSIELAPEIEVI